MQRYGQEGSEKDGQEGRLTKNMKAGRWIGMFLTDSGQDDRQRDWQAAYQ